MAAGALHSDHINYLIYRYLQEHGHENAALAFHRDWHRPREFRDPEDLPFAQVVQRHELISVVQKGLLYDELSHKSARHGKKFRWTAVNPRQPLDEQDLEGLEQVMQNGAAPGSRPTSSGRRKGKPTPATMRAPDEFPTPAPKRQRRSEGSEGVHMNGDVMDVDNVTVSPSAAEGEEEGGEPISPEVGSETETMEIPERYDSMDVATQTDVKVAPKTSTMYWKINRPGATVLHSMWKPNSSTEEANTLLTVGEGLCRFHFVPNSLDGVREIEHHDDPNIGAEAVVTAAAWHPEGHTAIYAVDSTRNLHDGKQEAREQILCYNRQHGSSSLNLGPPLLDPPGIVLAIRYSTDGSHVLVIRTNLKRGLVQVWRTATPTSSEAELEASELIAWRIFEHQVSDVCWTAPDRFLVSGNNGLSSAYALDSSIKIEGGFTADNVAIQGLSEHASELIGLIKKWDKVRLDPHLGVAVFVAIDVKLLLTLPLRTDEHGKLFPGKANIDGRTDLPGRLTAFAFRPEAKSTDDAVSMDTAPGLDAHPRRSTLLATAFEEGLCVVYRLVRPDEITSLFDEVVRLNVVDGAPALAIAWSPNGAYLAVSSTDCIQVWRTEDLEAERKEGMRCLPAVTWRPDAGAIGKQEKSEEEGVMEPSLSWSADGESLGFAVEQQIAVIRFRPALNASAPADVDVDADADGEDISDQDNQETNGAHDGSP